MIIKIFEAHRKVCLSASLSFVLLICGFLLLNHLRHKEQRLGAYLVESLSLQSSRHPGFYVHPFLSDSGYTVILPAGWSPEDLMIRCEQPITANVSIEGQIIKSSWESIVFPISQSNTINIKLTINNREIISQLRILLSSTNSIFINTQSGSMVQIDDSEDKSISEAGQLLALSSSGQIDYCGKLKSIHGRGNMTWTLDKKPYSIKLNQKASLFGLKKTKKFNLLANACDESGLRNWIMFYMSESARIPYHINNAFTILYLNGHYNGLYQITNKVDIGSSGIDISNLEDETQRVNDSKLSSLPRFSRDRNDSLGILKGVSGATNPKDISGGYLLEFNFKPHRYAESPSGFVPQFGYPIEIKSPRYATHEQVEYISNYYNEAITAIRAQDGINPQSHKHYSEYIDIDSFVYYYLISEILFNPDAVCASFFMYKDKGKKLCCGPLWDFDLCLNSKLFFERANGYNALFVRQAREKDGTLALFGQLYRHKDFRNRMIYLFNTQIRPAMERLTEDHYLDSIKAELNNDLLYNSLKWPDVCYWLRYALTQDVVWNEIANTGYKEIEEKGDYWNVNTFLKKRVAFFSEVWKDTISEEKYPHILWDYGRNEMFLNNSTQVLYLKTNDSFTWPRYLVSSPDIILKEIMTPQGESLKECETRDTITLHYVPKTN